MGYTDYKNQAVSNPSIAGTTVMAAAVTGTAVDLANRHGVLVQWTFGTSPAGTAAIAPYLHESSDNSSWGTVAAADVVSTKHGSLVGTTSVAVTGATYLMGYTGNKRYIRAYLSAGGALAGGTAVGGTANMPVSATVISFVNGIVPNTGT